MKKPRTRTYHWPRDNRPGYFRRQGNGSWQFRIEDGLRYYEVNTRETCLDCAVRRMRYLREMLADAGVIGPKELARREGVSTLEALAKITKKGPMARFGHAPESDTNLDQ